MPATGPRAGGLRRRLAALLFALGAGLLVLWLGLDALPRRIEAGRVVTVLPGEVFLDVQVLPFLALVGGGALVAAVAAWIGGALQRYDRGGP